jgi:tRNA G18 (ribose-2'-O)-methylase SpoU
VPLHRITSASDPRVADYRDIPDPELVRRRGVFVAEGRLIVRRLIESRRFRTRSVLVTETALDALGDVITPRLDTLDVYVTSHEDLIVAAGGLAFHRGCLALGERPAPSAARTELPAHLQPDPQSELQPDRQSDLRSDRQFEPHLQLDRAGAQPVVLVEAIANADNVGAIFRNAAAFGARAVLLDARSCDPLYRKATRTSMGATLTIPFAIVDAWPPAIATLRAHGYTLLALAPHHAAIDIDAAAARWRGQRVAVMLGSEGDGLSDAALALADARVSIPMAPDVDSLNVATAAAIALHRLAAPFSAA